MKKLIILIVIMLFSFVLFIGLDFLEYNFFNPNENSDTIQDGRFILTDGGMGSWYQYWHLTHYQSTLNRFGCAPMCGVEPHSPPYARKMLYVEVYDNTFNIRGFMYQIVVGEDVYASSQISLPFIRTGYFYTAQQGDEKVEFVFYNNIINARFHNIRGYGVRDFQFALQEAR